ncbi:hypothetical protein HanRHA438_Chr01g0013771 [Helianthus annuus]|nr:hypothetical protein HanRHA438_Chr01g0013771 [Helianthus annuus]
MITEVTGLWAHQHLKIKRRNKISKNNNRTGSPVTKLQVQFSFHFHKTGNKMVTKAISMCHFFTSKMKNRTTESETQIQDSLQVALHEVQVIMELHFKRIVRKWSLLTFYLFGLCQTDHMVS